ncbi:MAG: hypothetical protein RIS44_2057 [Pseudomonadota bacterium]
MNAEIEPAQIMGSDRVVALLGYWPTFHDAEVISFCVERAIPFERDHAVAHLAVHVRHFVSVGEGTAQYEQVLSKSVLIRFRFVGVVDLSVSDFNHQNVINAIAVCAIEGDAPGVLRVEVESIWGFGGTWGCSSVLVESVQNLLDAGIGLLESLT